MRRDPVGSSNLVSVGYDEERQILEVEFTNNRVYQYFEVPRHIYEGLMAAPSKGSYLDENIKKASFRYQEI